MSCADDGLPRHHHVMHADPRRSGLQQCQYSSQEDQPGNCYLDDMLACKHACAAVVTVLARQQTSHFHMCMSVPPQAHAIPPTGHTYTRMRYFCARIPEQPRTPAATLEESPSAPCPPGRRTGCPPCNCLCPKPPPKPQPSPHPAHLLATQDVLHQP